MITHDSESLARRVAELAAEKKAEDTVALDMRPLVAYTDFLVICGARNERQARAIADEVRVKIKEEARMLPSGTDGGSDDGWVVLDYLDCVLHVFTPEARDRYQLEDLWREAARIDLPEPETDPAGSPASA